MEVAQTPPSLHVLGLVHTVPTNDYSFCPFTTKVLRFSKMMKPFGYRVVEYANEGSLSEASEKVTIFSTKEYNKYFKDCFSSTQEIFVLPSGDPIHLEYQEKLILELSKRVQPKDFIIHPYGFTFSKVVDIFPNNIHIEMSVGYYPQQVLDKSICIFQSQALKNFHIGVEKRAPSAYEFVIPNFYDINDWTVNENPGNYIAYLGRIKSEKGMDIIRELSKHTTKKIIMAGHGDPEPWLMENIEYIGPITGKDRDKFLGNALCTLVPSTILEPFGGVSIESMLCGTPVLSSNHSVFPEYIRDGFNGFKNDILSDWIDSIDKVSSLNRRDIAYHTRSIFSLESIGQRYDKVFRKVYTLYNNGWYSTKPLQESYNKN